MKMSNMSGVDVRGFGNKLFINTGQLIKSNIIKLLHMLFVLLHTSKAQNQSLLDRIPT